MWSRLQNTGWSRSETERWSLLGARLVCLLLALGLLWMLARTFWLLVPAGEESGSVPARATANASGNSPAMSIAKWHLFGAANPQARASQSAAATTLDLTLRGTLADADPKRGMAVIANAQGEERVWQVGEEVTPGATLDEVHADRVVLLHGGVREELRLPRDQAAARVAPLPTGQRNGFAPRNTAMDATPGAVTSFEPPRMAQGALDWQKTMESIGGSPADVARNVRIEPVLNDGRIAGVRVSTANGDAALLGKLGLRPSDIVTAVNGVPVDSIERGQQILQSLKSAQDVRVTVTRDGAPAEITVRLQ